ncbi:hypothetical protein PF008_g15294 [Phytophthora fragariae]|uniref:RXLR phytopathogen effector protein WY-domain domain-containing protein n=1 Tax=Phytophthora fragariae TaxID=53985 RepID=A0A6G0REI2_9STRA|nr:hypothetical protein PF008_g15294 [Phytophthora fragariae]
MVSHAAESSHTKELGWRLIQEMWLSESMTAGRVFNRLQLDRAGISLFKQPKLTIWFSYVTKLDTANADEVMFSVLKSLCSKKQLAKMLSAAKEVDETKDFATKLEKQLLRSDGK